MKLKSKLRHFASFVIMRYLGLKANKAGEFRRQIAALGGDVEVMRKRILRQSS